MTLKSRESERAAFLQSGTFSGCSLEALPADASFRRYFRLQGARPAALLMDAAPPQEDVRPFVSVARHLTRLGLSAPQIYQEDLQGGFLVLEDFGKATYTRLLQAGEDQRVLYELAIDTLVALHNHCANADIELPDYTDEVLLREAMLLPEWYLPEVVMGTSGSGGVSVACDRYREAWEAVLEALPNTSPAIVLRDFHVDNLMRLEDRAGVAACGLLDFQDALIGPTAYDVVSLLEDARRDLPPELVEEMLQRYRLGVGMDDARYREFLSLYRVLGAQRHCKVLGIFVRLWRRDGKDVYLRHLPRVARLLRGHLEIPELEPLARWFEAELPEMMSGKLPPVTAVSHRS